MPAQASSGRHQGLAAAARTALECTLARGSEPGAAHRPVTSCRWSMPRHNRSLQTMGNRQHRHIQQEPCEPHKSACGAQLTIATVQPEQRQRTRGCRGHPRQAASYKSHRLATIHEQGSHAFSYIAVNGMPHAGHGGHAPVGCTAQARCFMTERICSALLKPMPASTHAKARCADRSPPATCRCTSEYVCKKQ